MHTGLDHLRENWDNVAAGPRRQAEHAICGSWGARRFEEGGGYSCMALIRTMMQESAYPRGKVLIEFGCGLGRVTQHLAGFFEQVIALDIAPAMVAGVRDLGFPNVVPAVSDGTNVEELQRDLPRPDMLYSEFVLLHNRKADVRAFWPKMCRLLPAGGLVLFQIPCYEVGVEPHHWTDVGVWTPKELSELAESCGCDIVRIPANPGHFSYEHIGQNHDALHVWRRR